MATKKRGLGKGLDALFVDNAVESESRINTLPIAEVEPNRDQPRKEFDQEALEELAASIAEHGVLQPILVRPVSGGYQIVAGERRWRAARLAGLVEIPAVIKEMTDQEVGQAALVENLQREDLNPVEEALGYHQLMEQFGMTQDQVAKKVSKSRPAVANAVRLLGLPETVLAFLRAGSLTAGHAKALLSLKEEEWVIPAAQMMVEKHLSVREAERYCKRLNAAPKEEKVVLPTEPIFKEVELSLTEVLGRRVRVITDGTKGKLEIEYFSKDDLMRLASVFNEKI
ncbi:ParB/RepB/Spo0J family partition protein [Bittarella massiliensis (ex Durand et al. 2017)]|uniref:ParB/RepB/Spo0J family partition protein n=1 Tax=Bittarella massiliensis (ex Durand et al. 2017) TaxID=1720313 RepID=UPI001AA0EFB0|nr:ParB/RepB/Spo0J family partition protein [Bittarella massiliensis (ex Durand et al. 2017)]MBO1680268.1 ParB/RepB/Spo0J family partition protein [Bittarella massiliensis (ex Durand et al. 2017)]